MPVFRPGSARPPGAALRSHLNSFQVSYQFLGTETGEREKERGEGGGISRRIAPRPRHAGWLAGFAGRVGLTLRLKSLQPASLPHACLVRFLVSTLNLAAFIPRTTSGPTRLFTPFLPHLQPLLTPLLASPPRPTTTIFLPPPPASAPVFNPCIGREQASRQA